MMVSEKILEQIIGVRISLQTARHLGLVSYVSIIKNWKKFWDVDAD